MPAAVISVPSLVEIVARATDEAIRHGRDAAEAMEHAAAAVMASEPTLSRKAARRLVETLCPPLLRRQPEEDDG